MRSIAGWEFIQQTAVSQQFWRLEDQDQVLAVLGSSAGTGKDLSGVNVGFGEFTGLGQPNSNHHIVFFLSGALIYPFYKDTCHDLILM